MENRLKEWEIRLNAAQTGHYVSSERYHRVNNLLGLPLVIISSFVSAFLFFDQSGLHYDVEVFLKAGGVAVAILASLQTFLRPSEKSEMHRIKAAKYGSLKRKVELFVSQEHSSDEYYRFSKDLMIEWNAIAEDSLVTPHSIRKKIKKVLADDLHRANEPNE